MRYLLYATRERHRSNGRRSGLTAEQKNAGYVLPCVSRVKRTVVVAA